MSFTTEIDQVTRESWEQMLPLFEDANLYQTYSYGAVHWAEKDLSHLVLKREGQVVAMAQLRIVRAKFAGGVAYLRWGPLCQLRGHPLELETVREMAAALHTEYVVKRRLFLRVLPNAFAGSEREKIFRAAFPQFKAAKPSSLNADRTIVLDLDPPLDALRKKLDQKWRNQLNRAEKNNLTIREGSSTAEYAVFKDVYDRMWSRKQFDTTVDVVEFGRLAADLPDELKFKILICEHEGKAVSSIVCSAMGNMGIYLLGATDDGGANTKGAYLLQWTMIKRLKENGVRYYDLGGIDPEKNPGVYHFKSGFSGADVTRITPLECCKDVLSLACMKAADLARGGMRGIAAKFKSKSSPLAASKPEDKSQAKPLPAAQTD